MNLSLLLLSDNMIDKWDVFHRTVMDGIDCCVFSLSDILE